MSVTSQDFGSFTFEGTISRGPVLHLFRVHGDLAYSCVDRLNDGDLVLYPGDGRTRVGHGTPKPERAGVE